MIRKRTTVRLGAVAAVATVGLGLCTGMASADTTFVANVPGCAGGMQVRFYGGHDHVQGFVTSTWGAGCSVDLTQSNGGNSTNWTNIPHDTAWTENLLDAGITSHVVVCNLDLERCVTSTSY
ncbi:hypothetical protein ACEZCY_37245 [Streptacidiphilus sp. N1-12]|uniref:Secreted protein n=2 Tax=Streptacidiphilus alkalitolerans TaxID=3342712 RepID=A0ABV6X959_9ACTN